MSNNSDMVLMTPCELQALKSKLGGLVVENNNLKIQLSRLEQEACNIKMPEGGKIVLVGHGDSSCDNPLEPCPSDDPVTVKQKYESNVDTNAFTDEYKDKVDTFVNINADWDAIDGPALILNKPALGTLAAQNGIFSGVSSGVNTGDQTASTLGFTPAVLADWTGGVDPGNTNNSLDQLAARVNTKVGLNGDEAISGIKTFSSSPEGPLPTTDNQLATKQYVDLIGGIAISTAFSSPAVQTLTNSYVTITGSSVVYQPLWTSSIISVKLYIHTAVINGHGIFHTKFFIGAAEQTAFRATFAPGSANVGENGVVLKGAFDNVNTASKTLTFQARNYLTGTHGSKLHQTVSWDGAASSQSVAVMLEIIEKKN